MKGFHILYFVGLIVLPASCKKTVPDTDGPILKGECMTKNFDNKRVSLCFDYVIEDSRCPANFMCFWAGIATAKFTFHEGWQSHDVRLSTLNLSGWPSQDTTVAGYKIHLVDLLPYPGAAPSPVRAIAEITR